MPKVVAIVGMPGSGKDEAVKHFTNNHFEVVYFGGLTLRTLKEEGREVTPENERDVRERLRRDFGPAAYAALNVPEIQQALTRSDVVINGLYSWAEYKLLREQYPSMATIAIWAPPMLRYKRLTTRPVRPLTWEEAEERDYAEIEMLDKGGPIAMADHTIKNVGTLAELKLELARTLDEIDG